VPASVAQYWSRDERGEPQVAAAGPLQQRDPERAGLGEETDPPRPGDHRCEAGVEPHGRVGVDHAQAVGADDPHPGRAGGGDEPALRRAPLRPRLAEAAGDDDEALDPLPAARLDDLGDLVGRHRLDGEVDVCRHRLDVRPGRHPAHVPGGRVDRVDRAGEPVVEQMPQHGVADLALVVAGAHHRDRRRREQPGDGA
jgi:hypothetical protein